MRYATHSHGGPHRLVRQASMAALVCLSLLCSAHVTPLRAQDRIDEPPRGFLSARPGFYVALDRIGTELHLDLEDPNFFPNLGFEMDRNGDGGQARLGWAFGRGFALELAWMNSRHLVSDRSIDAYYTRLQLDAVAPLFRSGRLQPYLAGGIGAAALVFAGDGIENTWISGSRVDLGGGFDLHLIRHLALTVGYRYEIVHFQEKSVEKPDQTTNVDFRGTATAHLANLGLTLSF